MTYFFVRDFNKLKEYGFIQWDNGNYFMRTNRAINLTVEKDTGKINFCSPTSDCIATICEMVQLGLVDVVKADKAEVYKMYVTKEEQALLYKMRKEKEV